MPRLFLSYRRADTIAITGRIHDRLEAIFGEDNVFKDVDDIPLGVDFRTIIENEIARCDVVLVIIGPLWASITHADGLKRLEDKRDVVRIEVESALKAAHVTVIPVLVSNAVMPSEHELPASLHDLVFLNAAVIRHDPDFNRDINRLIEHIKNMSAFAQVADKPAKSEAEITIISADNVANNEATTSSYSRRPPLWRRIVWKKVFRSFGILILSYLLVTAGVAIGEEALTGKFTSTFEIGSVASQNITAQFPITYDSQVLTEQARVASANAVSPVYDPPDVNIARQQSQLARQILDFINSIRNDSFATVDQKIADLQQITALSLSDTTAQQILTFGREAWSDINSETISVLERVMRNSIREQELGAVRNLLPQQVSVRFDSTATAVITAIVGDLLRSNTFINHEATQNVREMAVENVLPVTVSFALGELVIRAGEVIDAADAEALRQLGFTADNPEELILQTLRRSLIIALILLVALWLLSPRLRAFLRFLFSWRISLKRPS